MQPVITNEPNLISETNDQNLQTKNYELASLTRITFARIFDLLIVAIPQFLLSFFVPQTLGNWTNVAIVMPTTFVLLVIYFIGLPLLMKGNTLGKLIFNIRLRSGSKTGKIVWYALIIRELYFWFIPWLAGIVTTSIALLIMQANQGNDGFRFDANLVYNLGFFFFLLWFVVLAISIKVQKQHQAGIDIRFDLYVVNKNPLTENNLKTETTNSKDYQHVALTTIPAKFKTEVLDEIVNDKQHQFNQSINITDLAKKPVPKKIATKQEKLDLKKKKVKGN